jgi:hypothetical protein
MQCSSYLISLAAFCMTSSVALHFFQCCLCFELWPGSVDHGGPPGKVTLSAHDTFVV